MKWRLPWVSRRAYELLESTLERALRERNEYRESAYRAMDQMASRFGFEPVSAPVREEVAAAKAEVEAHVSQLNEDPGAGMLDESLIDQMERDLAGAPAK